MKIVRRIDYYGQLVLGLVLLLSVPVLVSYDFLESLFIFGCWQLVSAVFNTKTFVHKGRRKQIWRYWVFCTADLTFFLLSCYFGQTFNAGNVAGPYWIALPAAVFIAIYYLKNYRDLIQFFSLRDELDGLTKSKH